MPKQAAFSYIKHLRTYFCNAYYYVKPAYREQNNKLAPKALKSKLISYANIYKRLFWIWNPTLKKIVKISAIKFNENVPDPSGYKKDPSVKYEVVFTDSIVAKMEIVTIKLPKAETS